jgi:hypothetical protein
MKTRFVSSLVLFACAALLVAAAPSSSTITGDYVEARTASVFAGACHYNGELVTTGNDAIMAWNFASGSFNGVDLSGVRAMAAVTSDANLGDDHATRKSELVIDPSVSPMQAAALADLLRSRFGAQVGDIVSVRRTPIVFTRQGRDYAVNAAGFATLSVQPMPNDECCTQPELVWYKPLFKLDHRKVGYTLNAAYMAGTLADPWQRQEGNSAFYGSFTL